MIAQNIAMNAIQRGIKALVITASALLSRLSAEAAKPKGAFTKSSKPPVRPGIRGTRPAMTSV
jgi:hypothetical protein